MQLLGSILMRISRKKDRKFNTVLQEVVLGRRGRPVIRRRVGAVRARLGRSRPSSRWVWALGRRTGEGSGLSASSLGAHRLLEGQDDREARGVVAEGEAGAVELGHRRDQAQAEAAAGRGAAGIQAYEAL